MIDSLNTVILGFLCLVATIVIVAAFRQRRQQASPRERPVVLVPENTRIGVVALNPRHAQRWAQQRGLGPEQYYFIDTVDDLDLDTHQPLLYVAVNNYDRRSDWPLLYGELAKRGFVRWWPAIEPTEPEQL